MSLKQSILYEVENSTPWYGSNPRSLDFMPSSINSNHASDHQSNASQIYFYISGVPNQEVVYENDKNTNWRCPMAAILNFTICGKTVSLTAWHTAEMNSAQTNHIEPTYEVLFLKNAYRSLSRAIFQFFVLTNHGTFSPLSECCGLGVGQLWMISTGAQSMDGWQCPWLGWGGASTPWIDGPRGGRQRELM